MDGYVGTAFMGLMNRPKMVDRAKEELGTLMMFEQQMTKERVENEQAQIKEQAYYDEINKFSDKLLGPDRDKINQKAKLLQARVRQEIGVYGGDLNKFFENGGHSVIGDYKNSLMMSEEVTNYMSNKTNMDRLVQIQMSGKGHLINPNDYNSMVEYNKNKGGSISFTGMMNEIEMPDADLYDYGAAIPADHILDKNYMAIYGNYKLIYPDSEPSREDLIAFTNLQYGGTGGNWQKAQREGEEKNRREEAIMKIQADMMKDKWDSDNDRLKIMMSAGRKTKKVTDVNGNEVEVFDDEGQEPNAVGSKEFTKGMTVEVLRAVNERGLKQVTLDQYIQPNDYKNNALIHGNLEKIAPHEILAVDLALNENNYSEYLPPVALGQKVLGKNNIITRNLNDKWAPINAMRIKGMQDKKEDVAKLMLGDSVKIQNGRIIGFTPTSDLFLADGSRVSDNEDGSGINQEGYVGDYEISNVLIGAF